MPRGVHMGPVWLPADEARGLKLWRGGKPVAAIAARLGRSRNSIISRANRKGWGVHPTKATRQEWDEL